MSQLQQINIKIDEAENQVNLLLNSIKKRLVTERDVIQQLQQIQDKLQLIQERMGRQV